MQKWTSHALLSQEHCIGLTCSSIYGEGLCSTLQPKRMHSVMISLGYRAGRDKRRRRQLIRKIRHGRSDGGTGCASKKRVRLPGVFLARKR